MKGGTQTAVAIGVGYILGRRRKMRLATMLALGAATGGLGKLGPVALKRGAKFLGSTDIGGALGPQVGEIVSTIRGDLLDAGKAAATAAVSSRIDSLSDSLHDRADTLRNPEAAVASVGEATGRLRRRGRDADDEQDTERDEEERGNGRSRRDRSRVSRRARPEPDEADDQTDDRADDIDDGPDDYDLDEDAEPVDDVDEDEEPARSRRRTSRSPVSRTRR
jgi:hypothetical protein